jgi:putative transposase
MPRNQRYVLPDYIYHVTQRGTNRQNVFSDAADHQVYLDLLRDQHHDAGAHILAYCLMTNHVHLIVKPDNADSLAVLFRRVHGRYAQYFNARHRRSGHLWQGRYFSCPLSPNHLEVALRYVENNPVRARIVTNPIDYPWSSAAAHCHGLSENEDLLDTEFWKARGGADAWQAMLPRPTPEALLTAMRRCSHSERPFGPEPFIAEFETKLGRRWKRWPFNKELLEFEHNSTIEQKPQQQAASATTTHASTTAVAS